MRLTLSAVTVIAATLAAGAAFAEDSPSCGNAPESQWMSKDAIKAKAESQGLTVRQVKVEGTCYEIYAIAKDGSKVEKVVNPVTGEFVADEGNEG